MDPSHITFHERYVIAILFEQLHCSSPRLFTLVSFFWFPFAYRFPRLSRVTYDMRPAYDEFLGPSYHGSRRVASEDPILFEQIWSLLSRAQDSSLTAVHIFFLRRIPSLRGLGQFRDFTAPRTPPSSASILEIFLQTSDRDPPRLLSMSDRGSRAIGRTNRMLFQHGPQECDILDSDNLNPREPSLSHDFRRELRQIAHLEITSALPHHEGRELAQNIKVIITRSPSEPDIALPASTKLHCGTPGCSTREDEEAILRRCLGEGLTARVTLFGVFADQVSPLWDTSLIGLSRLVDSERVLLVGPSFPASGYYDV
uniref:Uncharacterized protein n=1 Tax=Cannabis sativa TaxID=3483 RepID=A0A803QSV2_CANSA